jgi:hypothetical protein
MTNYIKISLKKRKRNSCCKVEFEQKIRTACELVLRTLDLKRPQCNGRLIGDKERK